MADSLPPAPGKARGILGTLAAFVIVVAGLKAATPLVEPLLLAALVAVAVMPLLRALTRRGLPVGAGILVVVMLLVLAGGATTLLIADTLRDFTQNLPAYQARLDAQFAAFSAWLATQGIALPAQALDPGMAMSLASGLLAAFGNLLANGFLVLLVVVFMLLEAAHFRDKLRLALRGGEATLSRFDEVIAGINHYLVIKTAISLATGALIGLWLWFLGVDYALLWALLAFLLNFVPNIGSVIALVPPVLLALVQLGVDGALLAIAGGVAVNTVIGNVIEPRVTGRGVGLSPLVVMLSLVVWGWVLGPVGMLLSVPLTMIARIVLDASPSTRPLAILLGDGSNVPPATPEGDNAMFKVNEYFDGKVKSIGFESARGAATTGVMAAGEYEFNTGKPETMVITSGAADIQLKGESTWTRYGAGGSFEVPGNSSFRIRLAGDTTYLCYFH